ncbi:AAA family ATPase [Aquisphaera insulae]|uniref:AAA family ATPase n=1 Tax=Aquisphaera insulae TaxID=2712864 RepID=UPI0013EE37EA|nr:AAA family ATPase [Aquisphaera insulae]
MIERLYVHNYRCFENFSLDLAGRPSCLIIGKNGSGKSTLREALGVLQKIARGTNRVRDLIEPGDFTQDRRDVMMRFAVDVRLEEKLFEYSIAFELPSNHREARVVEESLLVDGREIFVRRLSKVHLERGVSFGADWHVVVLPVVFEEPGERSIHRIRSFLGSMLLLSPSPSRMSGFSERESWKLEPDASNFSSWLNAILGRFPAAYAIMESYLKSTILDFHSFENVPRGEDGRQLRVRFEDSNGGGSLSIDFGRLSDGEKSFFLSALITAASKAGDPISCFWDEPDHHLSISEVGHFVAELRRIGNRRGQLIATSHHPTTIRSFSDENTLVFHRNSHLEPTIVRPLTDFPYQGDLIEAMARDEVIG